MKALAKRNRPARVLPSPIELEDEDNVVRWRNDCDTYLGGAEVLNVVLYGQPARHPDDCSDITVFDEYVGGGTGTLEIAIEEITAAVARIRERVAVNGKQVTA